MRDIECRLIGQQQLGDHATRRLGAIGLGLYLHAGRGLANAARRQHALAFDLHHADAAIAVRAIAGLRGIAEVRKLDPLPTRDPKNGLIRACLDLPPVKGKGDRLALSVGLARCIAHGLTYGPDNLEPDDFSSSRHPALAFWLSMILSENRYPLFGIM